MTLESLINEASASLLDQQDKWLRSFGIETEEDARLLAKYWTFESGPIELVDTEDGGKKFVQTVRLVRRVPEVELVP